MGSTGFNGSVVFVYWLVAGLGLGFGLLVPAGVYAWWRGRRDRQV